MSIKAKLVCAATAAFVFAASGNIVQACTHNDPVFKPRYKVKHATIDDILMEIEIDNLTAFGSQSGDSCAAAVHLPEGLIATAMSVVHADSKEAVGFEGFGADAIASRTFCSGRAGCGAFASKVGRYGIEKGTPTKMRIEAALDEFTDNRVIAESLRRTAHSGVILAGGADKDGRPNHHLIMLPIDSIAVTLSE